MPMPELRTRAAALAKKATLANLPVITTASVPQGPNGPLIPEIYANAPDAEYVARRGEISVWDNPSGGVEFMRAYWNAAPALDPGALSLNEDRCFLLARGIT